MNKHVFIFLALICISVTCLWAEHGLLAMSDKKEPIEPIEVVEPESHFFFSEDLHLHQHFILGVEIQELNDQLAQYFGVEHGVLVNGVVENSPADSAGLKAGDIIIRLNETPIESTRDIRRFMRRLEKKEAVQLTYFRKEKQNIVAVIPTQFPQIEIFSMDSFDVEEFLDDLGELKTLKTIIDIHSDSILVDIDSLRAKVIAPGKFYFRELGEYAESIELPEEEQQALKEEVDQLKEQLEALREELEKMRKKNDE